MESTNGRIKSSMARASPRRVPLPTSKLRQMAIVALRPQAAIGMRFNQVPCICPRELNTSFIPKPARPVVTDVGCAAGDRTADHKLLPS